MPDDPTPFSRRAEELIGDFRRLSSRSPRRQFKRPTRGLPEVLEALLVKYRIGRDSPEHTILENWSDLVGAANAAYSRPLAIERGRLIVLTSHAVVRNELFFHRDAIVEKIRLLPGCQDVRNLNLRSG